VRDAAAGAGDTRDRLFNRDFVLLWQGQLVSQLGSQAFVVALMYWTMEATGSASVMALLMIGSTLPAIALGPIAGAVADRHSRKAIIVLGDIARGALMLGVAWVAATNPTRPHLVVAVLFAASLAGGVIGAAFNPAVGAAIPDLVPASRLTTANSLAQLSGQGAVVLGQAAGGMLYRLLGAPVLFFVDGISFLVSAASEGWMKLPATARADHAPRAAARAYLADARAGIACVWSQAGLRALVLTATVLNFVFTPVFVLLPFFVRDTLQADAAWYGFLLAGLSAGSVAGIMAAGIMRLEGVRRERALAGAFLLLPALLILLALTENVLPALALLFSAGLLSGSINVFVITLVQLESPAEMRGRVLSIVFALAQAAMPAGMALGGIAGDLTGMRVAAIFIFFGTTGLIACLIALRSRPLLRLLARGAG
jgi:MFS transporter, DHA3 family, macrolide efflux protein